MSSTIDVNIPDYRIIGNLQRLIEAETVDSSSTSINPNANTTYIDNTVSGITLELPSPRSSLRKTLVPLGSETVRINTAKGVITVTDESVVIIYDIQKNVWTIDPGTSTNALILPGERKNDININDDLEVGGDAIDYGYAVAVSANGDFVLVGAPGAETPSGTPIGSVAVYQRDAGFNYNLVDNDLQLTNAVSVDGSTSGRSVGINARGNLIIVGNDNDSQFAVDVDSNPGSTKNGGAVYVLRDDLLTANYIDVAVLYPTTGDTKTGPNGTGPGIGYASDISSDGNVVIAGGPFNYRQRSNPQFSFVGPPTTGMWLEDEVAATKINNGNLFGTGGVWVFRQTSTNTWITDPNGIFIGSNNTPEFNYAVTKNATDATENNQLIAKGETVAISGDGNTIAYGSPRLISGQQGVIGGFWIWTYSSGTWTENTESGTGLSPMGFPGGGFRTEIADYQIGQCLKLDGNGTTLVAGAPASTFIPGTATSVPGTGCVVVWTRPSTASTEWSLEQTLVGDASSINFGSAATINSDGNIIAVSDGSTPDRIWIFAKESGVWVKKKILDVNGDTSIVSGNIIAPTTLIDGTDPNNIIAGTGRNGRGLMLTSRGNIVIAGTPRLVTDRFTEVPRRGGMWSF